MDRFLQMWESLADEEYRREYSADVGTGLAFQIRMLRESNGWTQEQLATKTGKKQETISQWEDPNYGRYTLSSLRSLAAAFDVALIVKFAPFSELVEWNVNLSQDRLAPPSFVEEDLHRLLSAQSIRLTSEADEDSYPAPSQIVSSDMDITSGFADVEGSPSSQTAATQERRGPSFAQAA